MNPDECDHGDARIEYTQNTTIEMVFHLHCPHCDTHFTLSEDLMCEEGEVYRTDEW